MPEVKNNFKKVSVIMPVFNEEKTVRQAIERTAQISFDGLDKEIIVVDDGSTDRTREILHAIKNENIKLLYHQNNRGKGAALQTGFKAAGGDIIIIQDADLEYDPRDYNDLIKPILDNQAEVVYGSRFVGAKPHRVLYFWHYMGNKFITLLTNAFSNLNLTDVETCYKSFTHEVIEKMKLKENGFGFEIEFTIKASRLKLKFFEVGISYAGRTYAEGKKLHWHHGVQALWCVFKYGLFKF